MAVWPKIKILKNFKLKEKMKKDLGCVRPGASNWMSTTLSLFYITPTIGKAVTTGL